MPNATAFTAADRYLLLLDAEGQNPRHKADGMSNATAFIAADRYLLLLDAEGQNPRHKAEGMPNASHPELLIPQPEAQADFLRRGSASASGSIIHKTQGEKAVQRSSYLCSRYRSASNSPS